MEILEKFYDFFVICIAVLATIGGSAYLFFYGQPLFGVVNLLLAAMAMPYVVKRAKDLIK